MAWTFIARSFSGSCSRRSVLLPSARRPKSETPQAGGLDDVLAAHRPRKAGNPSGIFGTVLITDPIVVWAGHLRV